MSIDKPQNQTQMMEEEGQTYLYFDEPCLKNLVIKMGFSEQSVFFEQGSQKLICEVANDFITQVLELGAQVAEKCHKRDPKDSKDPKNTKKANQITLEDINFVLCQKYQMPITQVVVQTQNEQQK